jgi:GNAT superfamily N-acetyltransferase
VTVVVRPVGEHERAAWEPLFRAYLAFYETELPAATIDTAWVRLNDPAEPMFLLGAYADGRLVGIAQYLFHRSHWTISDYCYLQDLFVAPEARGGGAGRALIAAVENKAREAGAARLYWLTKEDNRAARSLYDKVADLSGFIQYRKAL